MNASRDCALGNGPEQIAELTARVRELDAFAHLVAHELQTPLGQLESIASLLQQRAIYDPSLRGWLQLLGALATRMRHTVAEMLDMARCDAAALKVEQVELTVLCGNLVEELADPQRPHPVRWWFQPEMVVSGHRPLVTLLMRNLLSNAAKYTKNVDDPTVRVFAQPLDECRLQITVEDNGAGFDGALAGRLFKPFERLHSEQQFPGTGLGLSIARRVVELHGGWIRGDGSPGRGARFDLCLPSRSVSVLAGHP